MKQRDWRAAHDVTLQQFATGIGVEPETAGRYENGRRVPAPKVMPRIFAFTEGQVRPDDYHELPPKPGAPLALDPLLTSEGDPG